MVSDFADAAHELIGGVDPGPGVLKLGTGILGQLSTNVEVAGLERVDNLGGELDAAVVVPAAQQTAENAGGGGHGGVVLALAKGGGGVELEGELAVCLRRLVVELRVVAKIGPGLGALGGAENAGDMQVGWPQVPGLVRVEVEPEGAELAEEAIVQQGDAPPAGGRGGDRVGVVPVNGGMSGRVREWMSGRGDGGMDG